MSDDDTTNPETGEFNGLKSLFGHILKLEKFEKTLECLIIENDAARLTFDDIFHRLFNSYIEESNKWKISDIGLDALESKE